jgi:Mor family transcriptional regulator
VNSLPAINTSVGASPDGLAPDMKAQAAEEDQHQQLVREVSRLLGSALAEERVIYQIASNVVEGLRERGHRGAVYIHAPGKQARNEAIKREFNGRNLKEICDRYNVAARTVYRIVSRGS